MMMDDEDDDRLYAELADEMSQPAEDGSEDGWSGSSGSDDDGSEYGAAREYEASGTDDDEVERAALQADEYEYQQRASYGQQQDRPSVYDDPIAHVREIQQEMQAQRSQREYTQFVQTIESHENAFKAITPDYHDAIEHLESARRSELSRLYPDKSPQAHVLARQHGYRDPKALREAVFLNDAQTVARQALQSGRNPAALYYELAQDRGFRGRGSRSSGRSSGGRSGGRSSGGSNNAVTRLNDLYAEDPEAFDREWDKMQKTGALG